MSIVAAITVAAGICLAQQTTAQAEGTFDESNITSTAATLIDGKTGSVIWSKSGDEKIYPASTTKVMTSLLLLEKKGDKLDEEVTVGSEVNFNSSNSLMGLQPNEKVTYRDLLYGMMMPSGNDAAAATAVALGGDIDSFIDMMNEKAKQLGMSNTHFSVPHGLYDGGNNYSTANDMAKVAYAAMQNETFRECVKSKEYTWKKTNMRGTDKVLHNTNKLIYTPETRQQDEVFRYQYATGIKTGMTEGDGGLNGCLIASASKDGQDLIAVIMGDKSTDSSGKNYGKAYRRWQEAVDLFEYGFSANSLDRAGAGNKGEQ